MNSKICDSCNPRIMSKPATPEYEAAWEHIFGKVLEETNGRREFNKR